MFISSEVVTFALSFCVPQSAHSTSRGFASFPAHTKLPMPALSPTMTSGTVSTWAKNVGDELKPGDTLATIETDKVSSGTKRSCGDLNAQKYIQLTHRKRIVEPPIRPF